MRARALAVIGLACGTIGVVPAVAADGTVDGTAANVFEPAMIRIDPGEQVTFRNAGGYHDLRFEDRAAPENQPTLLPWTIQRRFDTAGRYRFYCTIHGQPGGIGMAGVVQVGPDPGIGGGTAPRLGVRPIRDHFCTHRGGSCKRPGIFLRVSVDEDVVLKGTLERRSLRRPRGGRYAADGRVRLAVAGGKRVVVLLRRAGDGRIGVGDYRLTLAAARRTGTDRTRSRPVVIRFFVTS